MATRPPGLARNVDRRRAASAPGAGKFAGQCARAHAVRHHCRHRYSPGARRCRPHRRRRRSGNSGGAPAGDLRPLRQGGLLAVKGRGLDGARTRHRGSSHHSAPRDRHGGQRPWPNVRPGKASGRDRRVRRHTASGGCCERPVVAPTRLRRANPELLNDSTANRRFVFGVRKRVGGARRQLRDCAAVVGELTAVLDLATDR